MSKKEKVIDQLMQLSSWALEMAFAIEDDEDAGMSARGRRNVGAGGGPGLAG